MTRDALDPAAARPLLILAGAVLLVTGAMLVGDLRGARRWWIAFSTRQRKLFGRWIGPCYDDVRAIRLGLLDIVLGLVLLGVGVMT